MEADVILSADRITEAKVKDKLVVVIDVLRATSTIITALANGYQKVLPVATIERAENLARKLPGDYCLAGERGGIKIDHFDAGNSPREFTKQKAEKVILTTTNGTKCFTRVESAAQVLIGSLVNLTALTDKLASTSRQIVLCCAGTEGEFALDDFLTAGVIIDKLTAKTELAISDTAWAARDAYRQQSDLKEAVKKTASGTNLRNQSKELDIDFILETKYKVVPYYKQGRIKLG